MILKSLKLGQFRNYESTSLTFSDHINVIVGPNAQGKTNLLEGIFFLSRGYSHRAVSLSELASFGQEAFFIGGEIQRQGIHHRISMAMDHKKKILKVNSKKEGKQEVASRIMSTILFEPEDLRIVKAGPEKRRRFMDEEISGFMPGYGHVLKQYKKVLHQRNALLKEIRYTPSLTATLEPWDAQLIEYGTALMGYRVDYLKQLNKNARKLHHLMSSGAEVLSLYYQNNILADLKEQDSLEQIFRQRVLESRQGDIDRGSTTYGPHVDDLIIHINGMEARKYGSQGQQRTAAISLKLSQIDIYKESTGDYPIVLLDDILSELDETRQERILSLLGRTQAFITCTDASFARRYDHNELNQFQVLDGKIQKLVNVSER